MLSQAGRLELTNAVFTSLPTFYMCSLELPKVVIKQIDKYRKNCLWQGGEINARKPPKAAWKLVCIAKKDGGLGVLDLGKQNEALLLKNFFKFFNRLDIPWVNLIWEKYYSNDKLPNHTKKGSFWWRDNLKLLQKFKSLTTVKTEDGKTCLFWMDTWQQQPLADSVPELYSFAKNKAISIQKALQYEDFSDMFHLPLSQTALNQLLQVQNDASSIVLTESKDKWGFIWGSMLFSSARIYEELVQHPAVHPAFRWIWKSPCQPKHKVFFWLILNDRLSTRNILRRRNMTLQSYDCVLCNDASEECLDHLFLNCSFAKQCWEVILQVDIQQNSTFPSILPFIRDALQSEFHMVATILLCWSIWSARNDWIFKGMHPDEASCRRVFFKELNLVSLRVKPSANDRFHSWMQNIQNF